jgi:tetratricopeptide (TPR) repeat protein
VQADVVSHLRRMLEAGNRADSSRTEHGLLRAIGDAAQLAGWLAIDGQNYALARSYCQLALSVAEKSNDRAMRAYVLGVIGQIHLHEGEGSKALPVLSAAQELSQQGVPPAVQAWVAEAVCEAHACAGEPSAGLRALHAAETGFDAVRQGNTPAWLGFFNDECHMARRKGRCLVLLRQPREAARALFEALDTLPADFVRERSGTLIDLAFAYVQQHEIEEACRVAAEAEELARVTQSDRNLRRLRELIVELLPWTSQECVQDLCRRLLLK